MADHSCRVGCCCPPEPAIAAPNSDVSRRTLIQLTALSLLLPVRGYAVPVTHCCDSPELPPSVIRYAGDEVFVDLSRTEFLRADNSSARITDVSLAIDVLFVRDARGAFYAFSRRCTHAGGPMAFNPGKQTVQCTCWGHSEYNFDGLVIGGPARTPLPLYQTRLEGQTLRVTLPGGRV